MWPMINVMVFQVQFDGPSVPSNESFGNQIIVKGLFCDVTNELQLTLFAAMTPYLLLPNSFISQLCAQL
jgi:hypothetical protein